MDFLLSCINAILLIVLVFIQEIIGFGILELLIGRMWPLMMGLIIGWTLIVDGQLWVGILTMIIAIPGELFWFYKLLGKNNEMRN